MPKPRLLFAIAAIALLAPGCFLSRPRYLNWQKSVKEEKDADLTQRVTLRGFAFPVEPTESKAPSIWNLSPQGQAAYIKQLGSKSAKGADLTKQMIEPLSSERHLVVHDLTTFKKRIVLSVDHVTSQPADRISRLVVRIGLKSDDFKFSGWDRVATQYSSIDLGTMTSNTTTSFTLSPSLELMGDAVGTSAGEAKYERGMTEEIKLSRRYVEMNGRMDENTAEIILQGMPTRDLAGNIVAEVVMEADGAQGTDYVRVFDFDVFFEKGTPNKPNTIKYHPHLFKVPDITKDVAASLTFDAYVREVHGRGRRSIAEGDDRVRLLSCRNMEADSFALIKKEEMSPKSWAIAWNKNDSSDSASTDPFAVGEYVYYKTDTSDTAQILQLIDRQDAEDLLRWLEKWNKGTVQFKTMILCDDSGKKFDFSTKNGTGYVTPYGELDWFFDPFEPSDLNDPFVPSDSYDPFEKR